MAKLKLKLKNAVAITICFVAFSANSVFAQQMVSYSLQSIGSGDIYVRGKNASSLSVYVGDSITLNAVPHSGWNFVKWQGDSIALSNNANYSFVATAGSGGTIYALFQQYQQQIFGCTDRFAENYNPNATVNDSSCTYKKIVEPVSGCVDIKSLNYNPVATIADDSSCVYSGTEQQVIYGCTDPKSLNYNPNATDYDGSCVYPEEGNTFLAEVVETVVDTLGTRAKEDCQLVSGVGITAATITGITSAGGNNLIVNWEIIQGGNTVNYDVEYVVTQEGVNLFYLSIICKEGGLKRSESLRWAVNKTEVTGFTVSADYDVDFSIVNICQPKAESNFLVYPNPTKNILNVQLENNVSASIVLFDVNGKMVLSQAINDNYTQVNMSSLSKGNYILRLVENGKEGEGVQVIKE